MNIRTNPISLRETSIFLREARAALASPDVLRDEFDPLRRDSNDLPESPDILRAGSDPPYWGRSWVARLPISFGMTPCSGGSGRLSSGRPRCSFAPSQSRREPLRLFFGRLRSRSGRPEWKFGTLPSFFGRLRHSSRGLRHFSGDPNELSGDSDVLQRDSVLLGTPSTFSWTTPIFFGRVRLFFTRSDCLSHGPTVLRRPVRAGRRACGAGRNHVLVKRLVEVAEQRLAHLRGQQPRKQLAVQCRRIGRLPFHGVIPVAVIRRSRPHEGRATLRGRRAACRARPVSQRAARESTSSPSAPRGARVTELAGDEPLPLQPSKGRVEPAEAHVLAIVRISLEFEDIGMATRTTVAALVRRTSTGFF
jgi:hypothetical protein